MTLEEGIHCVRWQKRTVKNIEDYMAKQTMWHITNDCTKTLCGQVISLRAGLPEIKDSLSNVECEKCERIYKSK